MYLVPVSVKKRLSMMDKTQNKRSGRKSSLKLCWEHDPPSPVTHRPYRKSVNLNSFSHTVIAA